MATFPSVDRYADIIISIIPGAFYESLGIVIPLRSDETVLRLETSESDTEFGIYLNEVWSGTEVSDANGNITLSRILPKGEVEITLKSRSDGSENHVYVTVRDYAIWLASHAEALEDIDTNIIQTRDNAAIQSADIDTLQDAYGSAIGVYADIGQGVEAYRQQIHELRMAYRNFGSMYKGLDSAVSAFTQVEPFGYSRNYWGNNWVLDQTMLVNHRFEERSAQITSPGAVTGVTLSSVEPDVVSNPGTPHTLTYNATSNLLGWSPDGSLGTTKTPEDGMMFLPGPNSTVAAYALGRSIVSDPYLIDDVIIPINTQLYINIDRRGIIEVTLGTGLTAPSASSVVDDINDALLADVRYGVAYSTCASVHVGRVLVQSPTASASSVEVLHGVANAASEVFGVNPGDLLFGPESPFTGATITQVLPSSTGYIHYINDNSRLRVIYNPASTPTHTLSWHLNNTSYGPSVPIPSDGVYTLLDSDGNQLVVRCRVDDLPVISSSVNFTLGFNRLNENVAQTQGLWVEVVEADLPSTTQTDIVTVYDDVTDSLPESPDYWFMAPLNLSTESTFSPSRILEGKQEPLDPSPAYKWLVETPETSLEVIGHVEKFPVPYGSPKGSSYPQGIPSGVYDYESFNLKFSGWFLDEDTSPLTYYWVNSAYIAPTAYNDVLYYAQGYHRSLSRGNIDLSADGVSWVNYPNAVVDAISSAIYVSSLNLHIAFLEDITGAAIDKWMTSADGLTWTTHTGLPVIDIWDNIAEGNGIIIATSTSSTNTVLRSVDGLTWTVSNISGVYDPTIPVMGVTYGLGLFVIAANDHTPFGIALSSADGITWTPSALPASARVGGVAFGDGLFVMTKWDHYYFYSTDGIIWFASGGFSIPAGTWTDVQYHNGFFAMRDIINRILIATNPILPGAFTEVTYTTPRLAPGQSMSMGNNLIVTTALGGATPLGWISLLTTGLAYATLGVSYDGGDNWTLGTSVNLPLDNSSKAIIPPQYLELETLITPDIKYRETAPLTWEDSGIMVKVVLTNTLGITVSMDALNVQVEYISSAHLGNATVSRSRHRQYFGELMWIWSPEPLTITEKTYLGLPHITASPLTAYAGVVITDIDADTPVGNGELEYEYNSTGSTKKLRWIPNGTTYGSGLGWTTILSDGAYALTAPDTSQIMVDVVASLLPELTGSMPASRSRTITISDATVNQGQTREISSAVTSLDIFDVSEYNTTTGLVSNLFGPISEGDFSLCGTINCEVGEADPFKYGYMYPEFLPQVGEELSLALVATDWIATLDYYSDSDQVSAVLYEDGIPVPNTMWSFSAANEVTIPDAYFISGDLSYTSTFTLDYSLMYQVTSIPIDISNNTNYADYGWFADYTLWSRFESTQGEYEATVPIYFNTELGRASLIQRSTQNKATAKLEVQQAQELREIPKRYWSFIDDSTIAIEKSYLVDGQYYLTHDELRVYEMDNLTVVFEHKCGDNIVDLITAPWAEVSKNEAIAIDQTPPHILHQLRITVTGVRDLRDFKLRAMVLKGLKLHGSSPNVPGLTSTWST